MAFLSPGLGHCARPGTPQRAFPTEACPYHHSRFSSITGRVADCATAYLDALAFALPLGEPGFVRCRPGRELALLAGAPGRWQQPGKGRSPHLGRCERRADRLEGGSAGQGPCLADRLGRPHLPGLVRWRIAGSESCWRWTGATGERSGSGWCWSRPWSTSIDSTATPPARRRPTASWSMSASSTAAEMFVAAYDFAGRQRWAARPGPFASQHGYCSSPVLYENLVIVNGDHDGDAYLVALDRRTGQTVWKTPRENQTRSYCAPIIRQHRRPSADDPLRQQVRGQLRPATTAPATGSSTGRPSNSSRRWSTTASCCSSRRVSPSSTSWPSGPTGMETSPRRTSPGGPTRAVPTCPRRSLSDDGRYFLVVSDKGIASCFEAADGQTALDGADRDPLQRLGRLGRGAGLLPLRRRDHHGGPAGDRPGSGRARTRWGRIATPRRRSAAVASTFDLTKSCLPSGLPKSCRRGPDNG